MSLRDGVFHTSKACPLRSGHGTRLEVIVNSQPGAGGAQFFYDDGRGGIYFGFIFWMGWVIFWVDVSEFGDNFGDDPFFAYGVCAAFCVDGGVFGGRGRSGGILRVGQAGPDSMVYGVGPQFGDDIQPDSGRGDRRAESPDGRAGDTDR